MVSKTLLYINTIRYLKFSQIFYRIYNRIKKQRPFVHKSERLRGPLSEYVAGPNKPPSLVGPNTFFFIITPTKLTAFLIGLQLGTLNFWRYHLHYFDHLNSGTFDTCPEWYSNHLLRWISEIKKGSTPAWDPYPTSLRIVNWVKHFQNRDIPPEVKLSLYQQIDHLSHNIEWHLMANHLFVNAKALLFGGLFFEGPQSTVFLKKKFANH